MNGLRNAILMILILMLSISTVPVPNAALNYGKDTDMNDVDAGYRGALGFGLTVDMAGDVNGDGIDDVIMGQEQSHGKTYIVFGKTDGWPTDALASGTSTNASFVHPALQAYNPYLAGGGDFNGDGRDDVLMGRIWGNVTLYYGRASGWSQNIDLAKGDAAFGDTSGDDESGSSVATLGDVNGDSIDDFIIGSHYTIPGRAGRAFLFFGNYTPFSMNTSLFEADASFIGPRSEDCAGYSLADAGDVNGDHYDDILIGAPYGIEAAGGAPPSPGRAYLIFGKENGWESNQSLAEAGTMFLGTQNDDWTGRTVTGLGDIDGDGYDDFMIASAYKAYLLYGRSEEWGDDYDLADADATFTYTHDFAVGAGQGDFNGDGYHDILVASPNNDENGWNSGKTFIILGGPTRFSGTLVVNETADASFVGHNAEYWWQWSMATGGDLNNDGLDDIVIGSNNGKVKIIFPDTNYPPAPATAIRFYSDPGFTQQIDHGYLEQVIHTEVVGTDGNPSRRDVAEVWVSGSLPVAGSFRMRLYETGLNTGIYRGNFTLKERTHEDYRWIHVLPGSIVTVEWVQDPSVRSTLLVAGVKILGTDLTEATEDELYTNTYNSFGGPYPNWSLDTNASWLSLYSDYGEDNWFLTGTPNNGDVGKCWANVSVNTTEDEVDYHNFTITVANTPPNITTDDVTHTPTYEDYEVDYNSDDDGNGTITWHLATNSSWLDMDAATGNLTGSPELADIGPYWVNVSVDDGNGGWDWSNFTLQVDHGEQAPNITTADIVEVYEDSVLHVDYNATDLETNGVGLRWSLVTDAGWLTLDADTGVLAGLPDNGDVGQYHVNITVKDPTALEDHHDFTLTVLNVPPEILTQDTPRAVEGQLYRVDYNSDDDGQGQVTWSMTTNASWLTIDSGTGVLSGTPSQQHSGVYWVNVTVDDGNGGLDLTNFTLTVVGLNGPPMIVTIPKASALEDQLFSQQFTATDPDAGDVLTWSMETNASAWLSMDPATGLLSGTPLNEHVGMYLVKVTVSDSENLSSSVEFYLKVINVNDPPAFTSAPVLKARVGKEYMYDAEAKDDDRGDQLRFSLSKAPDGMTMDVLTGLVKWTPAKAQAGKQAVTVQVTDGNVTVNQTFTISVSSEVGRDTTLEGGWFMIMILLLIIIVVAILIIMSIRGERTKGPGAADGDDMPRSPGSKGTARAGRTERDMEDDLEEEDLEDEMEDEMEDEREE